MVSWYLLQKPKTTEKGLVVSPLKGEFHVKYANTFHYELQGVNPESLPRLVYQPFSWRAERMKAGALSRAFQAAGYEKYAERVENCATWLEFYVSGDEKRLKSANFCKLRLCPICTARGAIVRAHLLSKVMDIVEAEHPGMQYIFVTLTIRNVTGDKLGDAIGQLCQGWRRLTNQPTIKAALKGWFRAIEITRNTKKGKWYGTYHPHIHAIFAVEGDYFKRSAGKYLTHDDLVERWQQVLRVDYKPTVNVKATYEKDKRKKGTEKKPGEDEASRGAVLEAAKYATKDSDYLNDMISDEEAAQVVADYTRALHHRRLTAFGGWLKDVAQRLQADDLDHVDLLRDDDSVIREDMAEMIEEYGWHFGAGDYVLARRFVNPLRVKREEVGDHD